MRPKFHLSKSTKRSALMSLALTDPRVTERFFTMKVRTDVAVTKLCNAP